MAVYLVVLTTTPDQRSARKIASSAVSSRLAACVTFLPGAVSIYRWKGRVRRSKEVLLLLKTSSAQFDRLKNLIQSAHPYEVPEIIALPIIKGTKNYLSWLAENLT